MKKRAVKAGIRFLERREFEILEEVDDETIDVVAKKDGAFVFISIIPVEMFHDTEMEREPAEKFATEWLKDHTEEKEDTPVAFDEIQIVVIGESRAFLRHNRNCLR